MNPKVIIAIVAVVLLIVCCGAVACTPLGNAVPGVSSGKDCDFGDRLEGDSDCKTSKSKGKKAKKNRTTRTRTGRR